MTMRRGNYQGSGWASQRTLSRRQVMRGLGISALALSSATLLDA